MMDSRNTRLAMVLSANLILSLTVGFGIWRTNQKTAQPAAPAAVQAVPGKDAVPSLAAKPQSIPEPEPPPAKAASPSPELGQGKQQQAQASIPLTRRPLRLASKPRYEDTFVPPPPAIESDREPVSAPAPKFLRESKRRAAQGKLAGVKLSGVIGNKAILVLRRQGTSFDESPEAICLAPGEKVTTINNVPISILEVEPKKVVMNVGGDRLERLLPDIR